MEFTEYYKDIKDSKKLNLRSSLRELTLNGLSFWDQFISNDKTPEKPRIQFLYFHHVFKDEEKNLDNLLKILSKKYVFLSYSEAINKILKNEIDKPYIVFSSDDGLKNNLAAARILDRYDAKACFFINPTIINEKDFSKIKNFCTTQLRFPTVEFLSWEEVNLLQSMGHEIGSHTMNHINIADSNEALIRDEMQTSFDVIQEKCGPVKHFAFPYGRFFHFNRIGNKICFEVGYESCASAERGCHVNNTKTLKREELFIRRDQVVFDWNPKHIQYFISRNSMLANIQNSFSPFL
jgi:peptidoglycan/xylan/chitin deacetylase (PgdA/CDA1 family)